MRVSRQHSKSLSSCSGSVNSPRFVCNVSFSGSPKQNNLFRCADLNFSNIQKMTLQDFCGRQIPHFLCLDIHGQRQTPELAFAKEKYKK